MAWKIGRGMRLHRDAVLRAQDRQIKRRHDRGERGGGGLVPADLHFTGGTDVVGMMDRPCGEPERAALQVVEE